MRRSPLSSGGGSSLAPTLLYSVDLTAQGTQASIAAGPFTVAGKTWTFWDVGGFATPALSLTPTDGLKLVADVGGSSFGGVVLPLSQIGTGLLDVLWRRRVVVSARAEITTPNTGPTTVGAVLAQGGTTQAGWSNWAQQCVRQKADGWAPVAMRNGVELPVAVNRVTADPADDVIALTLFDSQSFAVATGAWSSGYPAPSAMHEHGAMSAANFGQPSTAIPAVSAVGVGAMVYQDAAAATVLKLKHLKVEVY